MSNRAGRGILGFMDRTIEYYDHNAPAFNDNTISADMSFARNRFLSYLPKEAKILDLGCGSGRDSKVFLDLGYQVVAVDGSSEMCQIASKLTGLQVRKLLFNDLDYDDEFDAVWASASLLHVPSSEVIAVLKIINQAVKSAGHIYLSVKQGSFEGLRNGRYFVDYDEESLCQRVRSAGMTILETWLSEDVRPDRNEIWINLIARKCLS